MIQKCMKRLRTLNLAVGVRNITNTLQLQTPNSKAKGKSPIIVRQAALDGEIRIWGKLSHYGPHSLIPADYWKIWHIEWFSTLKGESESEIAEIGYSGGEKYYDLMVSKAEIEKKWPSIE